jgi:hypothetical protein
MITVGIPSYDHIKTECVLSVVNLITRSDLKLHFVFNQSLYIDYNRNQLVEAARQNGSTHLMFIDSDIQFPPDGIARLLAHDKAVVGGYYNTRRGNNPIRFLDDDGNVIVKDIPETLFKCHVLPTGFMLIRMDTFDALSKPYFATITHEQGTIGEDVAFCRWVADAGIEIWCDPTIKLGHVGKHIY